MIDILDALPPRSIDARITRLHRRFGARTVFSLSDGAAALHVDHNTAWRLFGNLHDSRFRVSASGFAFSLLPVDPFVDAAKVWARQYRPAMARLPSPFSGDDLAQATQIPYAAANTVLSILARYGHLERVGSFDTNVAFKLPRRKVVWAGGVVPALSD